MKKIFSLSILTLVSFLLFSQENGGDLPPPPPCPPMQDVQFCLTNSPNFVNCEKTIYMTFTPKPSKAAEMAGCFYDPSTFLITTDGYNYLIENWFTGGTGG